MMKLKVTIRYNDGEKEIYLAENVIKGSYPYEITICGETDEVLKNIRYASYEIDMCDPAPAIRGDEGYEDYRLIN